MIPEVKEIINNVIHKIRCLFGFHTPSKITYQIKITKRKKYFDASEAEEWTICEYCKKELYRSRAGTMYELFGHTHQ